LGGIENISAYIVESTPGIEFDEPGHEDEVLIFVLEGLVLYENGRCLRREEAALQCPTTPYRGKYGGTESIKLLSIRVTPKPGTQPPDPALMKRVVRIPDIQSMKLPFGTGSLRHVIARTENMFVSVAENWPVMEFVDHGHWDPEIVFGLEGKLEYQDGRIVRPGTMVTNGYNVPHPGRYGGIYPRVRIIEAGTSLYRKGGGNQLEGELLPGYVNAWHNQTLATVLARESNHQAI